MNYLDLMNNVLRRLREETVTGITQSDYSTMVGDFINDAKDLVEKSYDWSALRTTLVVNTAADDNLYSLTNCGDDVKIVSVMNDTSNCFMSYQTKDWFNEQLHLTTAVSGSPYYYTFNGLDSNGDTQVLVSPKPDGVYSLRFDVIKRQPDLVNITDKLLIPTAPVLHLALALLARERGETGGTSTAEYFAIADRHLSDAIAIDAAKHPEETIFRTV